MEHFGLSMIVQLSLISGMAGLLWPEKVKPVFEILMFPWMPTYRTLRLNSIGAILFSLLLFVTLLTRMR
jgi:hypothetical protein